ncbi:hypothetical protein QAD02_016013 [Eretmocerus hayati]|uniref:Uncharacterized protein n=1 Tax=Eretmocerus hayati TaxID=131215 RepID=A0ACC2P9U8_9HYME|nr:hypothetical protein QAD02_016013 [Eretmocerus hayati]
MKSSIIPIIFLISVHRCDGLYPSTDFNDRQSIVIESVPASTVPCPVDITQGCYCLSSDDENTDNNRQEQLTRIHCDALDVTTDNRPENEVSSFEISLRPGELVRVQCRGSPKWEQLPSVASTEKLMRLGPTEKLLLDSCMAPESGLLEKLGIERVHYLKIEKLRGDLLTARDLDALPDLRYLVLSGNQLGNVSADLIRGLPKLRQLELRSTGIKPIPGFFSGASSMRVLELSGNSIRILRPGTFDGLRRLELLSLWRNQFQRLKSGTFRNLTNLRSLDLHQNNLRELPDDIFYDLKSLEVVNLNSNNLTKLPKSLFENNSELRVVKLMFNRANLSELPEAFLADLPQLKTVFLSRSGIKRLPENLVWGSTNLVELNLGRNFIEELPRKLLRDALELVSIDLASNRLKELPDDFYLSARKLAKIDLSRNRLTTIGLRTLTGLVSLRELIIEHNQLEYIHEDAFTNLEELKIVKIGNNKLTLQTNINDVFGRVSPFHPCQALEELHMSHNNISEIFSDWSISDTRLQLIDLSYNSFVELHSEDLQFMSSSVRVDLRHNYISLVDLSRLELISSRQGLEGQDHEDFLTNESASRDVRIYLDENPLRCDCEVYHLLRYAHGKMRPEALRYAKLQLDNLHCSDTEENSIYQGKLVMELDPAKLECSLPRNELLLPGDPCFDSCDCRFRPDDRTLLMNCSGRNLTRAPGFIEAHSADRVQIDLSDNLLKRVPDVRNTRGYGRAVEMSLARNKISHIDEKILSENLQVLKLEGNNLTRLDSRFLELVSNNNSSLRLKSLTLSNNPWICDCDSRELLGFVSSNTVTIPDLLDTACKTKSPNSNTTQLIPLSRVSAKLCDLAERRSRLLLIIVCSIVSIVALSIGFLAACFFRHEREIKIWLYSKNVCLCLVTEDEVDKDKKFDAFVSYSHKDSEFVDNKLVPRLEPTYKLCIHERDWPAGEWITEQISRSINESRRTIVVLSENFLASEWSKFEFRAALRQALLEKRSRLVCILYGEIGPIEQLDNDLRAYLRANTYVKWGEPWFWKKLSYAMPHRRSHQDDGVRREEVVVAVNELAIGK